MTTRSSRRSAAAQASLFCGVLLAAWLWDAASSGHLQEQVARAALGASALAGGLLWMARQG